MSRPSRRCASAPKATPKPNGQSADRVGRDGQNDNSRMRYVLRGGITIAIPMDQEEGDEAISGEADPSLEIVTGENRKPENSAPASASMPRAATRDLLPPASEIARPLIVADASVGFSAGFVVPSAAVTGEDGGDAQMWQRLPRHLQLLIQLADSQETEAAQKYYTRGFKESRRQLIERLLDPTLTLEDTARVLGVVPTTVRRYTNRGVLTHHRTVGQQRRFKLSDVLSFLEAQQAGRIADLDGDDGDDSEE